MKAAGAFTCVTKERAAEDIHQAIVDAVEERRGVAAAYVGAAPVPRAQECLPRRMQRGAAATEKNNGRKERKGRKKESGVVGAGLKPALLALEHREICSSHANSHG